MFDLTPLTEYHFIIFLAVFLFLYLAVWAIVYIFRPESHRVPETNVPNAKHLVYYVGAYVVAVISVASAVVLIDELSLLMGLITGAILILLIGSTDEKHGLSPMRQLVWQVLIAATVVYFGFAIPHVSNPFSGGIIDLSLWSVGDWIFPGSILAILWLIFVMNAFNWLDGLDGLAGSVSFMVFLTLAAISLLPQTQDSNTLSLALIGAAAMLAFLIWNFAPARAYLGTTGSWFIGLYLGVVAIIGGGKMATALLVLAIPALDAIFVIVQRLLDGKAPWRGDKTRHLHYRLLDYGLSPRTISLLAGAVTAALGATAVFMQTTQKIGLLFLVAVGMFILSTALYRRSIYKRVS